ncbi:FAD-dependent thymidylate synthase [Actinokineospora globicatena]|uniref:Flavin-dependent thymidylate synthase n=1 Tax=Actinokineospora globicatena TaxID=103729 RepID=A0A9W6QGH2_9PSEU|nr:FAD-dependent thymidylate synthase [Actinokineospora globicatena]MCP2303818.1 thymidylate synthase (FAD) [Actinokineospora globicatena]GLW79029.1 flavin-dependent thymidylate synthase [Actinokineospora globicatena]GLW86560.1 flavin-dependent thymidylate synthase [Actinokineospora globicatena]GLW89651.1 flavin-dependent thymidylate synthase [Actinokineospora globicatena]
MTSQLVRPENLADDATTPEIELRSEITVQLVDHQASDLGVVRAARVSTVGEIAHTENNTDGYVQGLIKYLMKARHGSPFEHNYLTFLVSAPIFTVRHMMRHRTWSFNEESARYREVRPVFYVPDAQRLLRQKGKPGHYQYVPGADGDHERLVDIARSTYGAAYAGYHELIERGVAREVARMVLPNATYSSLYATCNARSLMHFLSLRTHREDATYPSHPQHEIAVVAEAMEAQWRQLMPITHAAFESYGRVSP